MASYGLEDILKGIVQQKQESVVTSGGAEIVVTNISPSEFQPRKKFEQTEIDKLAASIKKLGLINPITVRQIGAGDMYEIIAGERRWRAAQQLGWQTIHANVKNISDKDAYAVALVENLQREDLNPIEEASGYLELLEKHGLTHDQIAEFAGKSRSTISNLIRILELQEPVKELVKNKSIDLGHAKLLVSLSIQVQINLAEKVVADKLSVRQLEALIKKTLFTPPKTKVHRVPDERFRDLAMYLKRRTGGNFEVEISHTPTSKLIFSDEECYDKFVELVIKV